MADNASILQILNISLQKATITLIWTPIIGFTPKTIDLWAVNNVIFDSFKLQAKVVQARFEGKKGR